MTAFNGKLEFIEVFRRERIYAFRIPETCRVGWMEKV